jgi:chromate transporter
MGRLFGMSWSEPTRATSAPGGSRDTEGLPPRREALREIVLLFLRLGATAFGGPAAHIGMMREEVVRRRRWLTDAEFLDLLGATNLIPGPNSTEIVIHIGFRQGGWVGFIAAGCAFIAPAMLITLCFAWGYVRFGALPEASGFLYGVKPVIIAIVAGALYGLARTAVKSPSLVIVAAASLGSVFFGIHELLVLLGGGVITAALRIGTDFRHRPGTASLAIVPALPALLTTATALGGSATGVPFALTYLFLFFLKVGSVLYGSGYVLLAFLRADLVDRFGWLTESQLLDAIAVGQFTPGPLFSAATFIGYLLSGPPGALLATLGIFLPSFFFVAVSGPLVPRIRRSAVAGAFLDGVNAASLALMAAVTWYLGRAAVTDIPSGLLAISAGVLLIRFRINSAWLVLGGAAAGLVVSYLRG